MVYIASDHGGFQIKGHLKKYLDTLHISYVDEGPYEFNPDDDYNDYAEKICAKISENDFGILICDTGIGMSIAANRHHNIRAALCSSIFDAVRSKEHNNANVLVLGSETTDLDSIETMTKVFFDTAFSEEERHVRRVNKLS